ncbi:MAG: Npt1/Npt2 family nucleotide transporter, partial [Myxococcota bacterium]
MFRATRTIRAGERRDAWTAFALLLGLIASHSMLETARDALFLAKIPAARLPWVYMAIAVASLLLTQAQARLSSGQSGRRLLSVWIASAGLVTLLFWLTLSVLGSAGLYALYVWSGVLTTLILVHFWTLLGDIFTITQAKRLYGFIGAGSVLGAITGSGLASALSRIVAPAELLLVAALGLFASAALPALLASGDGEAAEESERIGLRASADYVLRQRYARWVALFIVVSTAGLTFADYLFKSTVAAEVPAAELGSYFASVYFSLNLLSLLCQLFVVGWLLRRFDVITALALLPVILSLGAIAMLAAPGLYAALAIKGADGSLRYSVHRTASELLYVPLSDSARRLVKGFIDVLGQRGGQALASITILIVTALTETGRVIAILLAISTVLWLFCTMRLRTHYLDLFRRRVQRGQIEHLRAIPDLDLDSYESIVAALDSDSADDVIAALDVLEAEGRHQLVPALTLYHPSPEVVMRALTIIARSRRTRAAHATEHLLDHSCPHVRAAAAAAFSVLSENEQRLRLRLSTEESATVRATIMANLIASGAIVGSDARTHIDSILDHGAVETKIALAHAIAWREASGFEDVLLTLARTTEAEVRQAAVEAMGRLQASEFLPAMVDLLGPESSRHSAIEALVQCGEPGISALRQALADHDLPAVVRWQLPAALSAFLPEPAAAVMLAALPEEPDGMVRYRLLRALERLAQNDPELFVGRTAHDLLDRTIADTVGRAYRYLDRRLIMTTAGEGQPEWVTPGHELLRTILADKERNAIDRLFRLLGLKYPTQPFPRIYRGLTSTQARTSSLELIENILAPPLRGAVIGLIDDLPGPQRLAAAGPYHQPLRLSYEHVLSTMLDSQSETVKSVTVFHIGELGLVQFRDRVAALRGAEVSPSDVERTLTILDRAA